MDFPRLLAALDIIRAEKISNEDRNLARGNKMVRRSGQGCGFAVDAGRF